MNLSMMQGIMSMSVITLAVTVFVSICILHSHALWMPMLIHSDTRMQSIAMLS